MWLPGIVVDGLTTSMYGTIYRGMDMMDLRRGELYGSQSYVGLFQSGLVDVLYPRRYGSSTYTGPELLQQGSYNESEW